MAQIKVYGIREHLVRVRESLSETIHECVMESLQLPSDKRAHRFDELRLEKPVHVGRSIGGAALSSIGTRHSDRVAGLIYLGATIRDRFVYK